MTEERRYTIAEVTDRMDQSRAELEAVLSGLSEAAMSRPGPDGWSIKDQLAHLAQWETGMEALLRKDDRLAAMGVDRETWESDDTDAVNAVLHRQIADLTTAEALTRFRESRERMKSTLRRLDDDELYRPYAYFDPSRPSATFPAGAT